MTSWSTSATSSWAAAATTQTPLRGIIYTNSENSVIDVSVDVVPFEGDALHA